MKWNVLPLPSEDCRDNDPPDEFDLLADDREAHSAALHLIARLQRLEHLEDLAVELGRDTGAVIPDREGVMRAEIGGSHLDAARGLVMVLDGVADQVHQYLLQWHAGDPDRGEAGSDAHLEAFGPSQHHQDIVDDDLPGNDLGAAGFAANS